VNHGLRGFVTFLSIAFVLLALIATTPTGAQVISGDIVGSILDKTGATVPGASVEAVNVATGVRYPTTAEASGEYRINNLPVGIYNITASSANFAATTVNGFRVELNKTSTLQITLEIKGAVTSIEVSGQAAALDTTTAQLQSTFEEKQLADLPSASTGSGVLNLSLLSSGVATSGGVGAGAGPSVGGQRPRNNNFTIEGVDNNNKGITGPLVAIPNDAVAEFSLLQNQFSPEFGHSSGGQFNTVVKSGTNDFHGLAYIYNQNRHYDALDTLQAVEGLGSACGSVQCSPGPRFDQNRIGGNIGGPVLKNKLFFFVNYEYEPLGQTLGAGATCSPDAAGFATINSTPGLSATNVAVFEKFVQPGTTPSSACGPINWVNGTTINTLGLTVPAATFTNSKFVVASMDYNISTSDQLRGRYIYNSVVGTDFAPTFEAFFTPQPNKFHLVTINEYHTFTPTLTNELRLGFNRFAQVFSAGNFSFPGLDSFPNLQFNDLGSLQVGPDPNAPQSAIQNTYQLSESITWTKGVHTLKFGIEGRKAISPQTFTQRARGDYEYNNLLSYFQDAVPDYLAERSSGNAVYYGDQSSIYWYANDNWRIRPNFTLNLGLRYEYTTIPFTQRLQALNAESSVPGLIDFTAPHAPKNNWAPRIGFAWSPGTSGKTSIRAGAGFAYDVLYDNLGLLSLPPQLGVTVDCSPATCAAPFLANGGILPGAGGVNNFPTPAAARLATSAFVPVNQKDPKSIDWTLGIQHSFSNDYTVEVRYVGDRGIHLPTQNRLNAADQVTATANLPTFVTAPDQATLDASTVNLGGILGGAFGNGDGLVPAYENAGFSGNFLVAFEPWAASTYHGLAAQVTKRFTHGLQFVASYTFSHTIDNATADVFSTVIAPRRPQDFQNVSADRSNSILDHRHRFTMALIYDEPFFKNSNKFLRNTLGNWEFAPIYTFQSGQWATAQSGVDANLNGDAAPDRTIFNKAGVKGTGSTTSPLCTSAVPNQSVNCTNANLFCTGTEAAGSGCTPGVDVVDNVVGYKADDPTAQYLQANFGTIADVGRSTLQLNPINDWDVTALKRITITERFKLEFQVQAFNIFNHPQYVGGFLNDIGSIGFTGSQRNTLIPGSGSFNNFSSAFASNARTLQLALKIYF
jgi:Carboxypeptidase regulatory-like domain/TonB dependent receptor